MNNFEFTVTTSNNDTLNIPLKQGEVVFVLGANGVGKSMLMHSVYNQNRQNAKRISAHRTTWFANNAMNMTAEDKKQTAQHILNYDTNLESRWKDDFLNQRSSVSIFNLINTENVRARRIAKAFDMDNIDSAIKLSQKQAPIQIINELFAISNIPIVISMEKGGSLLASKNEGRKYSIAELSDGERNALLIATDVLTSNTNSMIIIDEPERHLHRSIISPLLSTLFAKRKDCTFIVSTHDVLLPIDNKNSKILLLRDCCWNGKNIESWDADLIENSSKIPDGIKQEILGSKRKILFVEGDNTNSLDKQIYQLIYPSITVQPLGDCGQVERAIEGISQTEEFHWLNVYGLIDADDRTAEQIEKLKDKGIISLPCYSVESLYYSTDAIRYVARMCSDKISKKTENELYEKAVSKITLNLSEHKERLCARLSERKVRQKIMSNLPTYKDIIKKEKYELGTIDLDVFLKNEQDVFDSLIDAGALDSLIGRYPIRETSVIKNIVGAFGLNRETYEDIVRKLIINEPEVHEMFKTKLNELTSLIEDDYNQQEN